MPTYEPEDWIFLGDDDEEVLRFNSLLELNVESGGTVPEQVIEQGGFAAYNKTQEPLKIEASVAIEGTPADLQAALGTLNLLKEDTKIFSVVTPEFEYVSMTLESFSYSRKREEGRGVLYIQMNLVEVREVATATTSVKLPPKKCKRKDCASQKNNGKGSLIGQEVDASQAKAMVGEKGVVKRGKTYYECTKNSSGKYVYSRVLPDPETGEFPK